MKAITQEVYTHFCLALTNRTNFSKLILCEKCSVIRIRSRVCHLLLLDVFLKASFLGISLFVALILSILRGYLGLLLVAMSVLLSVYVYELVCIPLPLLLQFHVKSEKITFSFLSLLRSLQCAMLLSHAAFVSTKLFACCYVYLYIIFLLSV